MTKNEAASVAQGLDRETVFAAMYARDPYWDTQGRSSAAAVRLALDVLVQAAPPAAPVQGLTDAQRGAVLLASDACASYGLNNIAEQLRALLAAPAAPASNPVGHAGSMPGTDGFTMACFKAVDVPIGTALYTAPPAAEAASTAGDGRHFSGGNQELPSETMTRIRAASAQQDNEPRCGVCGAKTTDPWLDHRGCQQLASAQQDEREALNKWKADCKSWGHPATPEAAHVLKEHQIAALVSELASVARNYFDKQSLRENIRRVVLDALLAAPGGEDKRWQWRYETLRALFPSAPSEQELDAAIDAALSREQPQGDSNG
ncbi:hypothetical protein D3C86_1254730 [compost metagenome]